MERLNDIHILDTETSTWTCPEVGGSLPHPRAGMTLTALRGRLYLFGGSGSSSKCFQDLQILDRNQMMWLDVMQNETPSRNNDAPVFRHFPYKTAPITAPTVTGIQLYAITRKVRFNLFRALCRLFSSEEMAYLLVSRIAKSHKVASILA